MNAHIGWPFSGPIDGEIAADGAAEQAHLASIDEAHYPAGHTCGHLHGEPCGWCDAEVDEAETITVEVAQELVWTVGTRRGDGTSEINWIFKRLDLAKPYADNLIKIRNETFDSMWHNNSNPGTTEGLGATAWWRVSADGTAMIEIIQRTVT